MEEEISYSFPFAAASNVLNTQDQVNDTRFPTMTTLHYITLHYICSRRG